MWRLEMVGEVREWLLCLRKEDRATARLVGQAIQALVEEGPDLGRPLVDRIKGASLHNLKELRPGSSGSSEIRILFVFDPERSAVLLVVGDKSGRWADWYRRSVPVAEERYGEWLTHVAERRKGKPE
ncbi:type II toxin-antitoxin system RelE/ParE family toxin [Streptomyces sp. NBC_00683]|uniref:type II toxin-antitoxin system RelE/ParE family toxin n=1 Tax=Streptomyces sp. NBC_00683 TaxID=2903670 RepID=UPI002E36CB18|nr:type II toxin-antitoxin system RelE/ParE family toxin [Streptomyces sp. NBC_00683]